LCLCIEALPSRLLVNEDAQLSKVLAVNKTFRFAFLNQFNGSLNNSFFKTLRNFDTQFAFLVHSGVCLVTALCWSGSLEWLGNLSGVDKALAIALFWLCLRVGLVRLQAKTNVCNVGGNKTSIFFRAVAKNKNTKGCLVN